MKILVVVCISSIFIVVFLLHFGVVFANVVILETTAPIIPIIPLFRSIFPMGEPGSSAQNEPGTVYRDQRVWKKNAPYLYDSLITTELEWPTLTVQWMPDLHRVF